MARNRKIGAALGEVPQPPAPVKRCIDAFHVAFLARHGFKPRISGGKDGALLKQLIATWGEADVLILIGEFFATTDPRVLRSDYTIGAFVSLAQHLKLRQHGMIDARTAENLDAAARAAGRK